MIRLTSALLVTTLITAPAFAGSASNSGARAHSNAVAIVNVPASSGASAPSGGGDPTINYTGGYTVRNTPDVGSTDYAGAANACGVGGGGGASGPGFGLTLNFSSESHECVKRMWFQSMVITGNNRPQDRPLWDAWAENIACSLKDVAEAAPAGHCGKPLPVAVAQAAPVALAVTNVATMPAPAWCKRARPDTEPSRAYVASVCGH